MPTPTSRQWIGRNFSASAHYIPHTASTSSAVPEKVEVPTSTPATVSEEREVPAAPPNSPTLTPVTVPEKGKIEGIPGLEEFNRQMDRFEENIVTIHEQNKKGKPNFHASKSLFI